MARPSRIRAGCGPGNRNWPKSALARKVKGSKNRGKARQALARCYERIRHRRLNFCHHLSKESVSRYDLIAFEKLNILGMVRSRLARSILDAAWGLLLLQIAHADWF
jgi:putative transposase